MGNKIYTEDDLHALVGEAVEVVRTGLSASDIAVRLSTAIQPLQMPVISAIFRAQEVKMQFPTELKSDSDFA